MDRRSIDLNFENNVLLCSEALFVILAASYAIWLLFDRPIGKLRSAWVSGRLQPLGAVPALQPA